MKLRPTLLAVLTAATILATASIALADDAPAPANPPGFFEANPMVTEMIVLPILIVLFIIAMASNIGYETIVTQHTDFWNKPTGTSRTEIPVPKEPSSPREIRNTLLVLGVIYCVLRLTCMSELFTLVYKMIGCFIDAAFH